MIELEEKTKDITYKIDLARESKFYQEMSVSLEQATLLFNNKDFYQIKNLNQSS
jgi:hypothetical protein